MFNIEELKNLLSLINITPITGKEAITVALLQQRINELIKSSENTNVTPVIEPSKEILTDKIPE